MLSFEIPPIYFASRIMYYVISSVQQDDPGGRQYYCGCVKIP